MTMIYSDWYPRLVDALRLENIFISESDSFISQQARIVCIKNEGWEKVASLARIFMFRWVALWGNHIGETIQLTICLESNGQYILLRTIVPIADPEIYSWTGYYTCADRFERHVHDLFGVKFVNHPNLIRWIRHKAWSETEFPLRKDFELKKDNASSTLHDFDYPFTKITGNNICEIPVGPVHAGIIEPGHFRFQVAGEDVFLLEERLGYVHKGIEKIAEGRSIEALVRLAGRISGDSTVAYAWAACRAAENAAGLSVPLRALFMRAIMAERERVANHLGDIGAICNDVGFAFAFYQFSRLRELWQRLNADIFGHRFMMDCIVFGGVKVDLTAENIVQMVEQIRFFKQELLELNAILKNNLSLQDRLKTTGILKPEIAKKIGALGYVGRASGINYDLRRDAAYAPYDQITVNVPVLDFGDVAARLNIRMKESLISLNLLEELLTKLPLTAIMTTEKISLANVEAIGLVEGWRGEIFIYLNFDAEAKVSRFYARDPSWLNWPALEHLIHDNIVPDFPVCNKSVNGSYSGHDL